MISSTSIFKSTDPVEEVVTLALVVEVLLEAKQIQSKVSISIRKIKELNSKGNFLIIFKILLNRALTPSIRVSIA